MYTAPTPNGPWHGPLPRLSYTGAQDLTLLRWLPPSRRGGWIFALIRGRAKTHILLLTLTAPMAFHLDFEDS